MNKGLRAIAVGAIALAGIGGLAACSSNPSARTVAQDVIDALDLTEQEQTCLLEQLATYTDEDLSQIASNNENLNYGSSFDIEQATEPFQAFVADLEECTAS